MSNVVTIKTKGSFKNFLSFSDKMLKRDYVKVLNRYAKSGLEALKANTPVDTGKTRDSWYYEIIQDKQGIKIVWKNSNVTSYGTPIVLFIQYGHYTKSGTFIQGIDFINPALKPIFSKIADNIWMEVTSY